MLIDSSLIRTIVFDLDGTLYQSDELGQDIHQAAVNLVARTRGTTPKEGLRILHCARGRLTELLDEEPTLTRTCLELGIDLYELHREFQSCVQPERYLSHDPILYALLDSLRDFADLVIYTNNNLPLTQKILELLGVRELFQALYTIEATGRPKPDEDALNILLEDIGGPPSSFLFVGDRPVVDLKLPESLGSPTLLVRETSDLLQIHKLLGIIP